MACGAQLRFAYRALDAGVMFGYGIMVIGN